MKLALVATPTSARSADPIEGLLREILEELRSINRTLGQRRQPSLTRDDRALLAKLLPPIAGALGSELFATRELFESDSAALNVALRGLNPRQVGKLLRRGEGQVIAGLMVRREGNELHAALWRIVGQ